MKRHLCPGSHCNFRHCSRLEKKGKKRKEKEKKMYNTTFLLSCLEGEKNVCFEVFISNHLIRLLPLLFTTYTKQ